MWQQFSKQWPNSSLAKIAYFETLRADAPDSLSNKELIQHLEVILEMDSNNLKMRTLYARTLRERREYSNAYREYRRILQEAEPNVDFLKEAVEFYEQIGKQWEANKLRDQIDSLPQHEQTKFQNSTN
jgi:cytochrome c-type biogenesis protein CcmH/NrfG